MFLHKTFKALNVP